MGLRSGRCRLPVVAFLAYPPYPQIAVSVRDLDRAARAPCCYGRTPATESWHHRLSKAVAGNDGAVPVRAATSKQCPR